MKGYTESRAYHVANIETEQVFDDFDAIESDRPHRDTPDERAQKIARLKAKVNAGEYEPDVMDIAKLLTSAMDPTL
nr:flagellar biosynthesis anti-sigma factor FlgM [uncultured Pseudodesulfovibrio sp.]